MHSSWINSLGGNVHTVGTLRVRSSFLRVCVLSLSLLLVVSLTGCGSGNPMANQNEGASASSWQFLVTPASSDVQLAGGIEAVLSLTPDKLVGTAYIAGNPSATSGACYNFEPIPLSGTIDAQGNISVTSAADHGQVLSFTGLLAPDRSSVSLGSYAVKGGCADGQSGSLTGVKFKPIGGVYSGTLTAPDSSVAVSANLTQIAPVKAPRALSVTGTVTYTSSACTEEFTITSSELVGSAIQLALGAKDGTTTDIYGTVNAKATQLQLADVDGGCHDAVGYGVLSLQ